MGGPFCRQESPEEQLAALETTSTVYVGNLSPTTPEELVWELFRKVGEVRRVIMGLDRNQMTPYGFCFVEYALALLGCVCQRPD